MAKTAKPKKKHEAVKEKLLAEREDLLRQMADLERHNAVLGEEGEPIPEDFPDPEASTFERERDLSLAENTRDLLDKVDHALKKIEDGTYGKCESCGKSIEAARLRALPHASLCIACKRKEEGHR
jgi:DnaK suppressor protein